MVLEENLDSNNKKTKAEKLGAGLFFTFITSVGFLSGFSFSISSTKKNETKNYSPKAQRSFHRLHNDGTELAKRALLRASLYSCGGFTLFLLGIWTLSGAPSTFKEFRFRVGSILPDLGRQHRNQGRTEFANLTELFQYVIDEDNKKKDEKRIKNNKND
jgi:hypothetical protein